MQDFFDAPPEGAIPTQTSKIQTKAVQWRPRKTPKDWVNQVTPELFKTWLSDNKVGFTTYDKEEKKTVNLQRFSFVVLDLVVGCDGTTWGPDNKPVARYYSNRVFDTRSQRLAVWMEGQAGKNPAYSGLYNEIKASLPDGVSYSKYFVAYCIELDCLVEIELNRQVETAVKKCLAKIDNEKGKKTKWESVNVFNIATNDHLWGFSFSNGFEKVDKEQNDYSGHGDMFFAPILKGGIVNPAKPENADLHGKCVGLQTEYRAFINDKIERGAKYNEQHGQGNDKQDNSTRNAAIDLGGNERQYQQPDNSGFHGPASVTPRSPAQTFMQDVFGSPRQEPAFDVFPFPTNEPAVIAEDELDLPF